MRDAVPLLAWTLVLQSGGDVIHAFRSSLHLKSSSNLALECVAAIVTCGLTLRSLGQFANDLDVSVCIATSQGAEFIIMRFRHRRQAMVRLRVSVASEHCSKTWGRAALPYGIARSLTQYAAQAVAFA